MKCLKPQLGNIQIHSVKNKEGNETSDIKEIIQITQEYFTNLYDTQTKTNTRNSHAITTKNK